MCPGNHELAGKRRSGKARKGDAALRSGLCESAWVASRTSGYLGSLYRHLHRRFGRKGEAKASFAVVYAILVTGGIHSTTNATMKTSAPTSSTGGRLGGSKALSDSAAGDARTQGRHRAGSLTQGGNDLPGFSLPG